MLIGKVVKIYRINIYILVKGGNMIKFTEEEIQMFFILFNRGGYVLNFSTDDFDIFTYKHVGVALCQKHGLSKGKSLRRFLDDADDEQKYVLITELFKYYEKI